MHSKFMQNVGIYKFWLNRVVQDFKLNVLVKNRCFEWKMKTCHCWKFRFFLVLDNLRKLQVFEDFDRDVTLHLQYNFFLAMDRKHAYESWEQKRSWNEWIMDGQSRPLKRSLTMNIHFHQHQILNNLGLSLWMILHLIQLQFSKCWKH